MNENQKKINACVHLSQNSKNHSKSGEMVFPAKVFGYVALCENLKHKIENIIDKSTVVYGDLPFVSSMTNRFSPQAAVYAHWAFLKY